MGMARYKEGYKGPRDKSDIEHRRKGVYFSFKSKDFFFYDGKSDYLTMDNGNKVNILSGFTTQLSYLSKEDLTFGISEINERKKFLEEHLKDYP